jgi:hypothetical protein
MLIHTHDTPPCYNTRIAICQGVRNAPVLSCAAHPCTKWGNGDATRGAADERCAVRLPGACARSDTGRLPVLVSALPPGSVEECAAPSVAGRVTASARLTDRAFSGAFWSRTPYVEHQEAQFPPSPARGRKGVGGSLRGRCFGNPLRAISRFSHQNAQTPPSPLVGEGGKGDEGKRASGCGSMLLTCRCDHHSSLRNGRS